MLAPTEVLAAQHFQNGHPMLASWPLVALLTLRSTDRVVLITGSSSVGASSATLQAATVRLDRHWHSRLLSSDVQFADLGLVVVDEQHRFGVEQRACIERQGERPAARPGDDRDADTALGGLTVFGDLETSTLRKFRPGGGCDDRRC